MEGVPEAMPQLRWQRQCQRLDNPCATCAAAPNIADRDGPFIAKRSAAAPAWTHVSQHTYYMPAGDGLTSISSSGNSIYSRQSDSGTPLPLPLTFYPQSLQC